MRDKKTQRVNTKNPVPVIQLVKEKIDQLNGAEFDTRAFDDIKNKNVAIAALCRKNYIKLVAVRDIKADRMYNIYQATGKQYPAKKSTMRNLKKEPEIILPGGIRISDIPKAALTIHRML